MNLEYWDNILNNLSDEAGEISGSWNGDKAGLAEERAHTADEVVGKVKELKELMEGLK